MAGTPTYWASLSEDQDPDPRWLELYYDHFDAITPWTVGRFANEKTADFYARQIGDDLKSLDINSPDRKIDFIPVVFPGFSVSTIAFKTLSADDDSHTICLMGRTRSIEFPAKGASSYGGNSTTRRNQVCGPYTLQCGTSELVAL